MDEIINVIVGAGIVLLNSLLFILKKPRYLFLTILISLIMLLLLLYFKV
jgi:hypothetical protein